MTVNPIFFPIAFVAISTDHFTFFCYLFSVNTASLCLPFLCSECGKRYKSKRTLYSHQLTHGERTIQCPECPAKFYRQTTFKTHYGIHQNFKYKCNECKVTYSNRNVLRKHIRKLNSSFNL